jgi:hypothetical protein
MSENNKTNPQQTFNAIARAGDIPTLQHALRQIDSHDADAKAALVDALEKYTIQEFNADMEGGDLEIVEGLMGLAEILGDDLLDAVGDDDLYDFHSLLLMADKVDEIKGDKTAPVLVDLLDAASQLSDKDYNSMTKLAKTFMGVAKKHLSNTTDAAEKPSNPFRGKKFGGPNA